MLLSGILSLLGLIAIPLDDMQIRIIGIVGYTVVAIPVFVLLGVLLGRSTTSAPTGEENYFPTTNGHSRDKDPT